MTADELRAGLARAGLFQHQLADAAGVSQRNFTRWVTGQRPIPSCYVPALLAAIAAAEAARVPEDPSTRVCTKCGENKPVAMFPRDRRMRSGRRAQCGKCVSLRVQQQRAESALITLRPAKRAQHIVINRPLSSARLDRLLERANVRYGP